MSPLVVMSRMFCLKSFLEATSAGLSSVVDSTTLCTASTTFRPAAYWTQHRRSITLSCLGLVVVVVVVFLCPLRLHRVVSSMKCNIRMEHLIKLGDGGREGRQLLRGYFEALYILGYRATVTCEEEAPALNANGSRKLLISLASTSQPLATELRDGPVCRDARDRTIPYVDSVNSTHDEKPMSIGGPRKQLTPQTREWAGSPSDPVGNAHKRAGREPVTIDSELVPKYQRRNRRRASDVVLRHVGQILDANGKKDTKADPLRVEADPLRVKADLCLDIGGGKHQVGVGLHHDIEVDQTLKEAGHHFIVKELREGEQMLKPHFHQFPLTVRETDVLPTQLVIPQTSLAPILVNTFQPPPARCMPPNQPSTFITSQQHQMVDTSLPPPSHLSNFNAFHMGASHINIGNINVQHEFNLFPNITQSHCLQGQSRSYQNYYQSEKDAYFDEKHCIISTIKSPPLPSCPPPPLPPPPPPQPSPPPLQLGHTAKNADTSSVSNIEVKITSSRTSSLLEQNKSDNILKITPSGTSPSLLEHHKSDRISTLWSKLGPVLSSHFKINDIVAEQETHFTAIMKPQVPIDKIKQVNSNFNKAELNLKDNNKQTHRENTDTSRVCMKKTLNKSFTIFQNKINKGQENVTNQTTSKNTKTHRFSTENLDNLIDHKSNNISKYENPILEDIHKKTCAVADSSLNNNTNVLKNEGSKPNYLSSVQEAKPLTHTFPSVLTTDQSTKLNAYSSTEVNENKDPPIENTINTDMLTHSSKQADTGSIANQTSDKAGNEMATNTKSIQISETLKSSSKYKEISEGKNASITDLPMKEEMGNLYKKSALHNIQINNSERTNTHSSDITHDCIDKISLMSVPTDVRQVTKDKLQIDTENTSKNISTKMYQTNPGKSTKHENNGASKRKSRPPSKFTLYCKPTVEISHSNTKDIGKETLKQQPATIHSQEKKSDLKDNNSTSRPANINYSNILEVDQSGVKISHTKNTSSKRSLSCFQYLPTHLFPNNPLLNISKGGIALKNKYKEARKHKLEYPDIKLGSIPYIKLKVIKNIHDEKREIERILSIRKSKECVSVNENKDSSLTYSASNTRHGKSLSVMHILNHMIADLTVKRRTVATQVTGKKNKLSGLVEVQPIGDSVTYPEWLKQAMEIVSKQSVICDEVIKLL
uniref:Uncharacterized protein n=1 Tax=Timema bartmani TaxID=61472 RepID=A0A7R9F882_9NEOP|nr:unnamed protein product [Timema bartmani]